MPNFDEMKFTVEALSGGKNTVIFDDAGMPSIMVPINRAKYSELITGGSQDYHEAFKVSTVDKETLYVSKFLNVVVNSKAYSLAGKDPQTYVNADQALTYCRNKGRGWANTPYSLWSFLALWCRKNGTMPRGNNNYGKDHGYPLEKGTPAMYDNGNPGRTLTGSGPNTWNHNWEEWGISDLNGNVWEWCSGMRIVDGEIQIIPYGNIFDPDVSQAAGSTAWKAIAADGTLVEPGTAGTLHWDWLSNKITLATSTTDTTDAGHDTDYNSLALESGLTVPQIAKGYLLYPDEPAGNYGGDKHWFNPVGERLPICGGYWSTSANAGVFAVYCYSPRSDSALNLGFRSAYCPL